MDAFAHEWSGEESIFSSSRGVGGEGREHAFGWKHSGSPASIRLTATPATQGERESLSAALNQGFSAWSMLESATSYCVQED